MADRPTIPQDALTTLRFHSKPLPGRFDTELLADIEREATHRMLALIAPDDTAGSGQPGVLRLGVGRLAAEIVQRMAVAAAGEAASHESAESQPPICGLCRCHRKSCC